MGKTVFFSRIMDYIYSRKQSGGAQSVTRGNNPNTDQREFKLRVIKHCGSPGMEKLAVGCLDTEWDKGISPSVHIVIIRD